MRLSHEMGQVAAGVRALSASFRHFTNEKKIDANALFVNDTLEDAHKKYVEKAEHYIDDVDGQFEIVEMMSKVHGDDIVVNPRKFDLWTTFFHRWHLIFNYHCKMHNHFLEMPFKNIDHELRNVETDPLLLQCALYNVANNAFKYSYVNTKIYINFEKRSNPEAYVFTIKNYGSYIDSDPAYRDIYERGVRLPQEMPKKNNPIITEERVIIGEGLGLYWTDKLVKELGGRIYHKCNKKDEPLCNYYVPYMEPFFEHYNSFGVFRAAWDKAKKRGFVGDNDTETEQTYILIHSAYNKLKKESNKGVSKYKEIVNEWKPKKIGFSRLYGDIALPTYEVEFIIEIPKFGGSL